MGKVSQSSVNYVIEAEITSNGQIERRDVIGAIYGQTEGLLGENLDLRELRQKGKIGRMNVELNSNKEGTEGKIEIPTSLDAADTSLLAASLETIEKVGPTNADIRIKNVTDKRATKRDYVLKRSKQILESIQTDSPGAGDLKKQVKEMVRESDVTKYKGFIAGPDVYFDDEIILVEGEADVKNLSKKGVMNTIALGGTSIPKGISDVVQDKEILTAFLDGDRGGDLILKELKKKIDLDFVARAAEDLEVEELSEKQVFEALRDKEDVKYVEEPEVEDSLDDGVLEKLQNQLVDITGSRAVKGLDSDFEEVDIAPKNNLSNLNGSYDYLVVDGEINESIVEIAEDLGVGTVFGRSLGSTVNSSKVKLVSEA